MAKYLMIDEETCHEIWMALQREWIPHYYERVQEVIRACGDVVTGSQHVYANVKIIESTGRHDAEKVADYGRSPEKTKVEPTSRGGRSKSPRHR